MHSHVTCSHYSVCDYVCLYAYVRAQSAWFHTHKKVAPKKKGKRKIRSRVWMMQYAMRICLSVCAGCWPTDMNMCRYVIFNLKLTLNLEICNMNNMTELMAHLMFSEMILHALSLCVCVWFFRVSGDVVYCSVYAACDDVALCNGWWL